LDYRREPHLPTLYINSIFANSNKLTNSLYYRYGISNIAAAAIGNGLLKDLGFIEENDHIDVLDASKIIREKARICARKH
jgi:hypothetical protein